MKDVPKWARAPLLVAALAGCRAPAPVPAPVTPIVRPLICRAAWGAKPVEGALRPHTIRRLSVHHSAVVLADNRKAPAHFRAQQELHQGKGGWPDIAYHFLIDRAGNIYEGRTTAARGDTFTEYDPTGHFLVLLEGNFEEQSLSEPQVAAAVDVLAWGAVEFGVSPKTLGGHRDYAQTACPGEALYALLRDGSLQKRVEARLASGGVRLERLCGPRARAIVAGIEAGESQGP